MKNKTTSYLRDITLSIMFLNEQMDDIDSIDRYPAKALLFQNPKIIERWVQLVIAAENLKSEYDPEYIKKWLNRTETYVGYLLILRKIWVLYNDLQGRYLSLMKSLIDAYTLWEKKDFISIDIIGSLPNSTCLETLKNDITQDYEELNTRLLKARSEEQTVLLHIFHFLVGLMDRVSQITIEFNPSYADFSKAIDQDLKEWTHSFGKKMFNEMKEDLNRHYKDSRTAPYTPELWGQMLDADEEALKLAKLQQLAECDDIKQEHWGEDMKKQMDDNGRLMSNIYSFCSTEDFIDLKKTENVKSFIPLLLPDNLSLFYDIIVRRNLIQCEMFPELKKQHEEWLNNSSENVTNEEESQTSDIPQTPNGDTAENALKACFKVCSEFVRGQIDKVIKESYNSTAANLALIEIVLFDHNLLRKRNSHKAFVNALVAWNLINVSDEKELNKIARAVADKYKRMPEEGYKSWSNDFVNDKSFCENIGKKLGDTIKYNR